MRAEFGYPIMVTPLSQFVGSQAAINVIVGERYREVTDQVIRYALGQHGEEAVELMDQDVRAKILDRPRAREIVASDRPLPTLAEVRRELGGPGVSDDELLLRWLLSNEEIAAMRAAKPPQPYITERHPIVSLLAAVAERTELGAIEISRPGFSLSLRRS